MKKKFVLTLALVLMVAVTLTAAAPVTMSGTIKAGYKFTFTDPVKIDPAQKPEISLDNLSISGDFWKVSVGGGTVSFDGDWTQKGKLSIYLDKALAEQGVDMGDVTLTMDIGNMGTLGGPTVYSDPNGSVGDNNYRVRMAGEYSTALTVGYTDMVSVYVAGSLVDSKLTADAANDSSAAGKKSVVIGATVAPVDGVKVAGAWANYAQNNFQKVGSVADATKKVATYDVDGSVGGSAVVDVAALADLDFALKVSAADVYFIGQKKNNLLAAVSGGYADVAAYVEYQLFDKTSNIISKISYSGIENVGLYAKVTLADLSNTIKTTVGAGASYKMGGVTYALDGSYKVADSEFALTPSVKVAF